MDGSSGTRLSKTRSSDSRDGSAEPGPLATYWSQDAATVATGLGSSTDGLTHAEAETRLAAFGPNTLDTHRRLSALRLFARQFKNPLTLILIAAAVASGAVGERADTAIILFIVAASTTIGFVREYDAGKMLEAIQARVKIRTRVVREGQEREIPAAEIVPGDVVALSAGSLVPADGVLVSSTDFFVSEAVLTGETFPVEKRPGVAAANAGMSERRNVVYLGSNVRSGNARVLVVRTGRATAFGAIADRLSLRPPETEFDRGVRRFGGLLAVTMLFMVFVLFALNVLMGRGAIEALLFSIALAVGLTPELLPAILSVNLSRSAHAMAERGVLVRHLNAIENFGAMDILCTDKTGTLTEGEARLDQASDAAGTPSPDVARLAGLNAALQTGIQNPLDQAILDATRPSLDGIRKRAEIPYDFQRKRMSVILDEGDRCRLVCKGAVDQILAVCTELRQGEQSAPLDAPTRQRIEARFAEWSAQGFRVLGLAAADVEPRASYRHEDERDLTLQGFLLFLDPPKGGVGQTLADLRGLGVTVKMVSGDNRFVARHVAESVGLRDPRILTGHELDNLHDEALWQAAERTDIFAEVDPNQKERIILALKKMGHVVGFLGDGINDAPALHAADIGISVANAVDVAREAADLVLLEPDLAMLQHGIHLGRVTFANTIKYVLTTTSANLGNMVSMAVASLYLPFFPLFAKQILLNNFLSDVPAMALANDAVDHELVERPRRWDMRFLRRFMLEFGVLSSAFDFLTFAVLLFLFRSSPDQFRTAWFVESLLTELVIALVVRTRRPFWRSRPSRGLWIATLAVVVLALILPYLPRNEFLGFVPLPPSLVVAVVAITLLYVAATEILKTFFYRSARGRPAPG